MIPLGSNMVSFTEVLKRTHTLSSERRRNNSTKKLAGIINYLPNNHGPVEPSKKHLSQTIQVPITIDQTFQFFKKVSTQRGSV